MNWLKEDRKNRDKLKIILTQVAKLVNAQKLRVSTTEAPLHAFHRSLSSLEPNTKVVFAMPSLSEELSREAARKQALRREQELRKVQREALDRARTAGVISVGGPPVRVDVLKAKALHTTTPVRLLCGSDDEAFSVQACEGVVGGLSSIIPDARLEVMAGGRHDVSLAEVEALAAAVQACAKPSQ